jgi:hypothetical protein
MDVLIGVKNHKIDDYWTSDFIQFVRDSAEFVHWLIDKMVFNESGALNKYWYIWFLSYYFFNTNLSLELQHWFHKVNL